MKALKCDYFFARKDEKNLYIDFYKNLKNIGIMIILLLSSIYLSMYFLLTLLNLVRDRRRKKGSAILGNNNR